ncbi:MAG TPA: NAD-dependent epimerase/dehydratase family protein [Candidatus Sulfotelmatobacter sp.]|nr:NAD-dependent epimerase/dehydratase family protein [Candidatus Sulfotelmatobacter sp.]
MKIVVIGGSGLIGSKLVKKLREHGHEAVAAIAQYRNQQHHRRRTRRCAERRFSGRRRNELSLMGGRGSTEVLRNINP